MIKITVELHSAISGKITKLGEMDIYNTGEKAGHINDYAGRVLRKPDYKIITRTGMVVNHDKINKTIWHLIAKMLKNMGYTT